MELVDPTSLAATLDSINDALFYGRKLSLAERKDAALWIAGRQGAPGNYAGMFAPTDRDYAEGARAFTGEKIRSGGGLGHILGEEACRVVALLDVDDTLVRDSLARARQGIMGRLSFEDGTPNPQHWGTYCCGICSVSFWRNLSVGGLPDSESRLAAGVDALSRSRDSRGRWGHFPFHYALLALSDLGFPAAIEEMRYAAPALERSARRAPEDRFAERRRDLAERVLAKC